MSVPALNLALVDVILKGVAEIVGCRVNDFLLYADIGTSLHVDVMDEEFAGKVPAGKLAARLCTQITEATGLVIEEGGRCTNEGCTVTIQVALLETGGLYFGMGL